MFLLTLGVVMLISTCAFSDAAARSEDVYHNVKRQMIWMGFGTLSSIGITHLMGIGTWIS